MGKAVGPGGQQNRERDPPVARVKVKALGCTGDNWACRNPNQGQSISTKPIRPILTQL